MTQRRFATTLLFSILVFSFVAAQASVVAAAAAEPPAGGLETPEVDVQQLAEEAKADAAAAKQSSDTAQEAVEAALQAAQKAAEAAQTAVEAAEQAGKLAGLAVPRAGGDFESLAGVYTCSSTQQNLSGTATLVSTGGDPDTYHITWNLVGRTETYVGIGMASGDVFVAGADGGVGSFRISEGERGPVMEGSVAFRSSGITCDAELRFVRKISEMGGVHAEYQVGDVVAARYSEEESDDESEQDSEKEEYWYYAKVLARADVGNDTVIYKVRYLIDDEEEDLPATKLSNERLDKDAEIESILEGLAADDYYPLNFVSYSGDELKLSEKDTVTLNDFDDKEYVREVKFIRFIRPLSQPSTGGP